jgi:hypothetical protein
MLRFCVLNWTSPLDIIVQSVLVQVLEFLNAAAHTWPNYPATVFSPKNASAGSIFTPYVRFMAGSALEVWPWTSVLNSLVG